MKNAIVTGSSRGLGKAIALHLAREGYRVWLSARGMEGLKSVKEQIKQEGHGAAEIRAVDLASAQEIQAYADELESIEGDIDILVNNAGIYIPDTLEDPEQFDLQMEVNFKSAYKITQRLLPRFMNQRSGYIFNICSVVNREPRLEAASYTISKHALYGYHQLLHKLLQSYSVKVTAFFPGSINTSSWEGIEAPKKEFIQPEDVASMLVNMLKLSPGTLPSEIDLSSINPDY